MKFIICGDSHAWTLAARPHRLRFVADVVSVGGATAIGMRNPNSQTNALNVFSEALLPRRPNAVPVIQLGEVDCGFVIWWRSEKLGESVEAQFESSIAAYLAFLVKLAAAGYPVIIVSGATVPTIKDGQQGGTVNEARAAVKVFLKERTALTLEYNARLRSACADHGWRFVDIGDEVLNPITGVVGDFYRTEDSGDHHLHPARAGELWALALNKATADLARPGMLGLADRLIVQMRLVLRRARRFAA